MSVSQNVFEALAKYGHDIDFDGKPNELWFPTMYGPGSPEKIEVMRQRVELGVPIWHPNDEPICSTLGIGGDKFGGNATYGKTASMFATRLNKTLSD
jgi:hypothetical protein